MKVLSNKEMIDVKGGGYKWLLGVVGLIVFVVGIIDGYFRPQKCRN